MAFDRSRSQEVKNGVILNDGPGLFSDTPYPTIVGNEVEGDRYVDGLGTRWRFNDSAWVLDQNFSAKKTSPGEIIEISVNEQNLIFGMFTNLGMLKNFGEFVAITLPTPQVILPFPDLPPDNFSYTRIASGETKEIPNGQQMNVFGGIQNLGQLNNLGELNLTKIFQDDPDQIIVLPGDNFSHTDILPNEAKTIPSRQQMVVIGAFRNLGQVNMLGSMALLSGSEPDYDDDYLPPWKIDVDELFTVKSNRVLQVPRSFVNLGQLNNNGFVYIGG